MKKQKIRNLSMVVALSLFSFGVHAETICGKVTAIQYQGDGNGFFYIDDRNSYSFGGSDPCNAQNFIVLLSAARDSGAKICFDRDSSKPQISSIRLSDRDNRAPLLNEKTVIEKAKSSRH